MKISKTKTIGLSNDWKAKKYNITSVVNGYYPLLGRYLLNKPGLSLNQANLVTKIDQYQNPMEQISLVFTVPTACFSKSKTHINKNPLHQTITPTHQKDAPKIYIW